MRRRLGRERLIQITGNDALTGFTAPKVLWVQQNEPEVYAQARHILLPKDYIRFKLTGDYAMDKADGAGTILFDLQARATGRRRCWPRWRYRPSGCRRPSRGRKSPASSAQRPRPRPACAAGTPVVGGGGDQAAQAVGVGAVEPGIVALTLGTSGVVFATTPSALVEPEGRLHAFCHAVPGRWHFMGVMLSAAGSLQWYRDSAGARRALRRPGGRGRRRSARQRGPALPALPDRRAHAPSRPAGARRLGRPDHPPRPAAPDPRRAGGRGLRHQGQLHPDPGRGLGGIEQVRVSGGGAKSALWRQIMADVLGVELVTVNTTEGAAYGAALLAAVGAGLYGTVEEACQATIQVTGRTQPGPAAAAYADLYPLYQALYPSLRDEFKAIGDWVTGDLIGLAPSLTVGARALRTEFG